VDPTLELAIRQALESLGREDPTAARMAIASVAERSGEFWRLADAVNLAASQLEHDGGISSAALDHLADVIGSGPLQDLVDGLRS
jgi:hypothetical protein